MAFLICLVLIVIIAGFVSYKYYKLTISEILEKLILLDTIFEARYAELTKAISQFQKYMPEHKDLIFDVQKAKADAAKVSKPKTTQELAQKILNENALTLNLNYLIDKCDFQNVNPVLKECVTKQVEFIHKISQTAQEYNKLMADYKKLKNIFPFNVYSKIMQIDLDLDFIKTE